MSAPFEPRSSAVRRVGTSGYLRMTLRCARNVYDATDRRMAEATALAKWLSECASAFNLADADIPDEDALDRARRRGVAVQDWRKVGVALKDATRSVSDGRDTTIGRWLEVIAETLSLDPLEADILSLALHYRLEKRVGGFDLTCVIQASLRDGRLEPTLALQRTEFAQAIDLDADATPIGIIARLEHALDRMDAELEEQRRRAIEAMARLAGYQPRLGETFPLQGELDSKLGQLAEIEADLASTESTGADGHPAQSAAIAT